MRHALDWGFAALVAVSAAVIGCGGSSDSGQGGASTGGDGAQQGAGGSGTGAGKTTGPGATTGTSSASGGSSGAGGSPAAICDAPLSLADTSKPDAVVGKGTAASCTESALVAAVAKGGTITFACGAAPMTLTVTKQLEVGKDTVLDGNDKVTLNGGGKTRILHLASAWNVSSPTLRVQRLTFTQGFTSDVMNTKATTEGGAAIFREGGTLEVVNCTFTNNQCASSGQDVSGGAITSQGQGPTTVVGSTFVGNSGSNGGAVGNLGNDFTVANSTFDHNAATGTTGNPGNGGNGGAIMFDGAMTTFAICGSTFTGNSAGAQGGAIFRVAYTTETTSVDRSTFDGNQSDLKVGLAGAVYLEHTTIEMTATTLSNNKAHYGGAFWIGDTAIAHVTNVTIANNVADQGGGVWVAGNVTGTLQNVTLANNTTTPGGYAPTVFSGSTQLALADSIVDGGGCKDGPLNAGNPDLQYPDSGAPCVPSIPIADPKLGTLTNNGGPTKTIMPGSGSPAIGAGTNCPMTDQRGKPRPAKCTLGAVEPG